MCSTLSWAESKTRIEEEPRNPASPEVVPFVWKNFPPEFLKPLADRIETEFGAPIYPLRVSEDAQTRAQQIFDHQGPWIYSLPPPFGSDPHTPLKAAFPQLFTVASALELRADEALFDPSRIKLLPSEHLEQYLYVRDRVVQEPSLAKEPETLGLRTLQGLEEDFHISEIRILANGIALDIAWPEGFTNRLDIYRATDLVARDWQPVASMLETVGLSSLSWTHANSVSPMGFYVIGNADLDSDQDGLRDAFEIYVSGTDPNNPDTDGDGLADKQEIERGTLPTDPDSFPQEEWFAVFCEYPSRASHRWTQRIPAGETREVVLLGYSSGFARQILSWTISINGAPWMSGSVGTDDALPTLPTRWFPAPMHHLSRQHYGLWYAFAHELATNAIAAPPHAALTVTLELSVHSDTMWGWPETSSMIVVGLIPHNPPIPVLRVDANNDGVIGPEDDAIKGDTDKPGKIIACSVGDANQDGIPDFADMSAARPFAEMRVALGGALPLLDRETAYVWLNYRASDPSQVQTHVTPEGTTHVPADGLLRVWTKNGTQTRNPASILDGGDFVPPGTKIPITLVFDSGSTTNTLYVEGIAPCDSQQGFIILVLGYPARSHARNGITTYSAASAVWPFYPYMHYGYSDDLVRVTVLKIDSVETYCDKFGASGSFGVNPEIFAGGQTDFGQPDQPPPYWWLPGTYANPSSQVLKVFFKYIKDANDEPAPFDIDLKANILPDSIPDDQLNISWINWAGPSSSGSFDKTDEREVKFQNPTKGGLYKFRMEMQPPGCIMASDAWVLLPKAGGEIADWMVTEVPSLVTRAANWETAVRAVAVAHSLDEDDFLETAWKAIATCDFDYQGIVGSPTKRYSFRDSDRPAGHTPDPSIPGMAGEKGNGDWDEPSYATLKGIVVHRAKINNAMYAVWGRELGYSTALLQGGAFWNAMGRGLWDDSTSQNAVVLGGDLYDAHSSGGNLSAILTKTRAKSIQSPDTPSGLNDVNLWPDTTAVSGFTLPTMPTDYDSLNEGENEMPRGRLF